MSDASEPVSLGTLEAKAARQVIRAICFCGEAFVRKEHKQRSHRKPIDAKVDADLEKLLDSDWPESRYFEFIRAYQAHIDKRCGTWTQAENLQAMVSATSFFLAMAAKIDPPKGRPRRMKPSPSGRIFDHMTLPNSKLDIENDLDSLVKEYLRLEKSLKIGVFAGKESFAEGGTGSLEEAIAYIDADMDGEYMADIQEIRMPPGKQLELFIDLGGTPERFNAFKMRLYRTKEKHRTNQ